MANPLSPKQLEFILHGTRKWNIAHGSVRSGKTECTLFAFMHSLHDCPDSQIYMVGHSNSTIFDNAIRLLFDNERFSLFKSDCFWQPGYNRLNYKDKQIYTLGANDSGAIGKFQGKTMSRVYCDEMTLYPESVIDMIDSRLSLPYSRGYASMNPSHPNHKLKKWIDKAEAGDPNYYSLHFTLDDNPYLDPSYKQRLKSSTSGLFYKRNYLGLWCLAEGSIFDFFDRDIYVVKKPPRAAEYWVAGIDVGTTNPFACLLIGVSTGLYTQLGPKMWVEKEYYWDPKNTTYGRQKTNAEFADDVQAFLEPYAVRNIYIDPSAAAFKQDLRRKNLPVVDANNEVLDGIYKMSSMMRDGDLLICSECVNTIREIESYTWDPKASENGEDAPLKRNDHSIDALRYVCATHKVTTYNPYQHNVAQYQRNRFEPRSIFGSV